MAELVYKTLPNITLKSTPLDPNDLFLVYDSGGTRRIAFQAIRNGIHTRLPITEVASGVAVDLATSDVSKGYYYTGSVEWVVNLPNASLVPNGSMLFFKNGLTNNSIVLNATASGTIEGASSYTVRFNNDSVILVSNASLNSWMIASATLSDRSANYSGNTVAVTTRRGNITTDSLTTSAGNTQNITLTCPQINASSIITAQVIAGGTVTSSRRYMVHQTACTAGQAVITIANIGSTALDGTLIINYRIV